MAAPKEWYRNSKTGELGYKTDETHIRLDRPETGDAEQTKATSRKFKPEEWVPVEEHRPLAPAHLAEICFNADAALCRYIGLRENSVKEWHSLTQDQKRRWITDGPTKDPWRQALWKACKGALKGLCE
jgi:hypothetical protein